MGKIKKSVLTRLSLAVGFTVFGVVQAIFAHYAAYFPGDLQVARLIQSIHNPVFLGLMTNLSRTFTGWPAIVLIVACAAFAWRRLGWPEAAAVVVAGLSSFLLVGVIKPLVGRPRPSGNLVDILLATDGLSFPSGHTFFAVMLLGIVAFFGMRNVNTQPFRLIWLGVTVVLIMLVGCSRVYLGAHWGSDVVGSLFFAGASLTLLTVVYDSGLGWLECHRLLNRA
jgi:undecaprenyl-diphosphatase